MMFPGNSWKSTFFWRQRLQCQEEVVEKQAQRPNSLKKRHSFGFALIVQSQEAANRYHEYQLLKRLLQFSFTSHMKKKRKYQQD